LGKYELPLVGITDEYGSIESLNSAHRLRQLLIWSSLMKSAKRKRTLAANESPNL